MNIRVLAVIAGVTLPISLTLAEYPPEAFHSGTISTPTNKPGW